MDPPPPTFVRASSLPESFKSPTDFIPKKKRKKIPMILAPIPPFKGGTDEAIRNLDVRMNLPVVIPKFNGASGKSKKGKRRAASATSGTIKNMAAGKTNKKVKRCAATATIEKVEAIIGGKIDDDYHDVATHRRKKAAGKQRRRKRKKKRKQPAVTKTYKQQQKEKEVIDQTNPGGNKRKSTTAAPTTSSVDVIDLVNSEDDLNVNVTKRRKITKRRKTITNNVDKPNPPTWADADMADAETRKRYGYQELDEMMDNHTQPFTVIAALTLQETKTSIMDIVPTVKQTMHDGTHYSMNVTDRKCSRGKERRPKVTFGDDAPATLKACAKKLSRTKQVKNFNSKINIAAVKAALTSGDDEETIIDDNVTLFVGTPKRLVFLLEDAGALPVGAVHAEKDMHGNVCAKTKIPVLYDKVSKRIFFVYYYLGCLGQWNGTEGKCARILVKKLNDRNPYLKSRSKGRNHNQKRYKV